MLNLPRFILLTGRRDACKAFSKELVSRDPQNIGFMDFEAPIITSVVSMLYDSNFLYPDFDKPETWTKHLPYSGLTVEEFVTLHTDHIRNTLGSDILGRIFLDNYLKHDWAQFWKTTVLRDANHPDDLEPINNYYGRSCYAQVYPTNETVDDFLAPYGSPSAA